MEQAAKVVEQSAGRSERTTTINEREDATKGVDDGWYTCVVYHGDDNGGHGDLYSVARCEVIIVDLCADNECHEAEICSANYDTGEVACTCQYECPMSFDVLCSDTCEIYFNECAMEEQVCRDKIPRNIANKGFCPGKVDPEFRGVDQDIDGYAEEGQTITLHSGLVKDGTPLAHIQWVWYPLYGDPQILSAREEHVVVVSRETAGVYRIVLMHCMDSNTAVRNEYRINYPPHPTTAAPIESSTSSSVDNSVDNLVTLSHVCSVLPGGVIEDLNSHAHFYDLKCTHVLAADMMPGGDYLASWFVYGTFDEHDGAPALSAMTFYFGSTIFEFQRGWIVHTGHGEKLALTEGQYQAVGDTGCYVAFRDAMLLATCKYFEAYFDGIMAGHIKMNGPSSEVYQKSLGQIGLCFDNTSGHRPNWQVGRLSGVCEVDLEKRTCAVSTCDLAQAPVDPFMAWSTCGVGSEAACNQLQCEGAEPSPAQRCALEKANRVNCGLKTGGGVQGVDVECPQEKCEWYEDVVSRGCPQEHLPFQC